MTLIIPQDAVRSRLRWILIGALTLVTLCLVVIVIVSVSGSNNEPPGDIDPPANIPGLPLQMKPWLNATQSPASKEPSSPVTYAPRTTTTTTTTTTQRPTTTTQRTTTRSVPSQMTTVGELSVLVRNANIDVADGIFDPHPDLMVTVVVDGKERHRRRSTSVKDNTKTPVWDENITFDKVNLDEKICFEVWDSDGTSADDRVDDYCMEQTIGDLRSQNRLGNIMDVVLPKTLGHLSFIINWQPTP